LRPLGSSAVKTYESYSEWLAIGRSSAVAGARERVIRRAAKARMSLRRGRKLLRQ
jgi:hypothetical protein